MMGKQPFSVLMACYRGDVPEQLEASLRSVTTGQTRRPDEVVLVVDGPLPPDLDAALGAAAAGSPVPVVVHRLPVNGGLGRALNAGLAVCRNDIVGVFDVTHQRTAACESLVRRSFRADRVDAGAVECARAFRRVAIRVRRADGQIFVQ